VQAKAEVIAQLRSAGCVFAEEEAELLVSAATSTDELDAMLLRRLSGEPLEHVLGFADFCGRRITVAPGVFVPRRRSEVLVSIAEFHAFGVMAELCCGAAAVATVLASRHPDATVHAADLDAAAVQCAQGNLAAVGGHAHQGDLFGALPSALHGRLDLVVANAPYVPSDQVQFMPREARVYEPALALDGGPDGLDVQRAIAAEAGSWLAPGGRLVIETSLEQLGGSLALLADAGFATDSVHDEDVDATAVIGTRVTRG
jgi:release factor glutamine methyltransferase